MSANSNISPGQFRKSLRSATTPPVTPPTSAPVSSGTPMNAAAIYTFSSASRAASAMASPSGKE